MVQKWQQLMSSLQQAQEGFAYEMLNLQIQLDQTNNEISYDSISRLLVLYMQAVEVLQSSEDIRYKYFSKKIQNIIKKRTVLESLQKANNNKIQANAFSQADRAELGQKKQDHEMQLYLSAQQLDKKKIREIVQNSEDKIRRFENRVKGTVMKQDKDLQQRIRLRKIRSVSSLSFIQNKELSTNLTNLEQYDDNQFDYVQLDIISMDDFNNSPQMKSCPDNPNVSIH